MTGEAPSSVGGSARAHAGVERDGLTVVAFDSEAELQSMLGRIGITVDAERRLHDRDGVVLSCQSCDKPMPLDEVGHVLPGSTLVYCSDPVCVLDYIERFG